MFLKNFKKASSDKDSTTLKHTDGHELKIAHKGLSKKMRSQLDELPHYNEGGDVQKSPVTINVGGQPTPSPSPSPDQPPTQAPVAPAPAPQQTPSPAPTQAEAPQEPQQQAPAPTEQPTQPDQTDSQESMEPAPVRELAQAKQTVGAQGITPQSPDYEKDVYAQTLNNKDGDYYKDLAMGHIKPETYQDLFNQKDTLGKVGTLFGLLVAGAGSGLTHQPNAVLHMMDQQITNDFEAQKQNKTNALTMLQRYQQHQNDLSTRALQGVEAQKFLAETAREREEALGLSYKNKMFISALHSIESNNDKLPPGPRKAAAQQSAAAVQQGVIQKVSENNAKAGQMLSDAETQWKKKNQMLSLAMPDQAKYQAERHLPGTNTPASEPISDKDRDRFSMQQNLLEKAQDLRSWAQQHQGSLNPATVKEGETKSRLLQDAYRQANGEGVFRKGESDFISGIVDSEPSKFLNKFRVDPKFKALENSIQTDVGSLKRKYGLGDDSTPAPSATPSGHVSKSGRPMKQDPSTGKWFYIK